MSKVAHLPLRGAEETDEALAVRARGGDQLAFATLYRRHVRFVAGLTYRALGSDLELDDVVQQVFIEAARGVVKMEEVETFRGWLYVVAVRQIHRVLVGRWRRRRMSLILPRFSNPDDAQPISELARALEQLPPEERLPWILHEVEGETLPETARACEVSLATVKRRIARAEQFLSRRFERAE